MDPLSYITRHCCPTAGLRAKPTPIFGITAHAYDPDVHDRSSYENKPRGSKRHPAPEEVRSSRLQWPDPRLATQRPNRCSLEATCASA